MKSIVDVLNRYVVIQGYRFYEGDRYITSTGTRGTIIMYCSDGRVTYTVGSGKVRTTKFKDVEWVTLRPLE